MKMAPQMQVKEGGEREISEKKKSELASLLNDFEKYNTIIITSIENMPALMLQKIRRELKSKVSIKIVKRRIIVKLFEEVSKNDTKVSKLVDFCSQLKDSCAVMFSNEDVFSLIKLLSEKKQKKKAKPGPAKEDIVVEARNTGLMPGPILTELSDAGIKSGLEKGKVVIKERFEVKAGQNISRALANALEKLNVLPVTAKLFPLMAYDKKEDILFKAEDLEFNVEQQLLELRKAYVNAFALMLEAKYFTKESVQVFLQDAYKEAYFLAKESNIINKDTIKELIVEAYNRASLINKKL